MEEKMKPVNKESKQVIEKLVSMMKDGYLKLDNSGGVYMPVVVEQLSGNQVSFAHYGEQNGDLMADPEMIFWKHKGEWFPVYYLNHWAGAEIWSVQFQNDEPVKINKALQRDQADFANLWMMNIKEQQEL
jgi:hypothetical protein